MSTLPLYSLSIVLPAKNEANSLAILLPSLKQRFPNAEIIVVNDGSTDHTEEVIRHNNVRTKLHPVSKGNGAAIKSGARMATGDFIAFMDADGQHSVENLSKLLEANDMLHDMIVGARTVGSQASKSRGIANYFYNKLASWMVGFPIKDLTSGIRVVRAKKFRQFLYLLPNGFSYPTTITMAFFRAGYNVKYVTIETSERIGKSHIRLFQDGFRFLIIIFKIGTLYSPLKIFLPISFLFFLLASTYYAYTYIEISRFTNMSALLYITSTLVFLIGLVSEQITALTFKDIGEDVKD